LRRGTQGIGYAISLAGFFMYNYIKMQKPAPTAAALPRRGDYTLVSQKGAVAEKGEV
jgi:hypothetical protein